MMNALQKHEWQTKVTAVINQYLDGYIDLSNLIRQLIAFRDERNNA